MARGFVLKFHREIMKKGGQKRRLCSVLRALAQPPVYFQ